MAPILPRFYQARLEIQQAKVLKAECDENPNAELPSRMRLPGDPRKLRGIPVVGVYGGVGGHIPGTRPDTIR